MFSFFLTGCWQEVLLKFPFPAAVSNFWCLFFFCRQRWKLCSSATYTLPMQAEIMFKRVTFKFLSAKNRQQRRNMIYCLLEGVDTFVSGWEDTLNLNSHIHCSVMLLYIFLNDIFWDYFLFFQAVRGRVFVRNACGPSIYFGLLQLFQKHPSMTPGQFHGDTMYFKLSCRERESYFETWLNLIIYNTAQTAQTTAGNNWF